MLEIYFDGVLLDTDKYLGLTQKGKMFDKEFKLGSVISREFKLTIPKADFNPNTKRVLIKYMSNDYAHLIIDSYEYSEGGIPTVDITLVDKMVLADFGYDASPLVPTTTLNILQDICNKIGVVLGNTDFVNNDIPVNYYDNTMTARQYISFIAEVAGGFARIENDGKLYIRNFNNGISGTLIPELCEQILIGKKHRVERVVYDNGLNKIEKILQSKNLFDPKISSYTKPHDYYVLPINLEKRAYTISATLIGTNMNGVVVGIAPYGERYTDFSNVMKICIDAQGHIANRSFVVDETWTSPKLIVYSTSETIFNDIFKNYNIQLEKGSVKTSFEPFGDIAKTSIGKNKLNIKDIIQDGFSGNTEIKINETGFNSKYAWANMIINNDSVMKMLKPDTYYVGSAKVKIKSRPTTLSSSNHTQIVTLYNPDGGNIGIITHTNKNTIEIDKEEIITTVFKTPTNLSNYRVLVYDFHGNNDGGSSYSVQGEIEITELMIRERSVADTTYEPFAEELNYLETVYLSPDNVYVTDDIIFGNIADKILGFEYYNIDTGKTYVLPSNLAGDVLKLTYENQDYYTIEQFEELNFLGSWQGSYKLEIDSGLQQETKVRGINTQVKAIKVNLDRTDNILQLAVSDISAQKDTNNELLNKIQANQSLIEQTAKEINQSVTEVTGKLNENIETLGDDLTQITESLQEQIIIQQTLIKQLSDSITSTIKQTGGNNVLRNSVGLAGLDFWTASGSVTDSQDSYTEQNTVSGSKFVLNGASTLRQSFNTQVGNTYGVGFKIRHIINGTANAVYIRIHRTETDYDEVLVGEETTNSYTSFEEFNTYTYQATNSTPFIEIINTGDDTLEISDLIISIGETQAWSGYFDEVYGKEHRLDKYGLKLTDIASGNYSEVTNNTMRLVNNNETVAELSKLQAKSDTGIFANKIQLRNLQMVALDDDNIVEYV